MAKVSASPEHMAVCARLSAAEQEEVIKQMLDVGSIQPCTLPLGAPVLFVRKKDNTLRMCYSVNAAQQAAISASSLCASGFSAGASF
jgi:hypothetical protein